MKENLKRIAESIVGNPNINCFEYFRTLVLNAVKNQDFTFKEVNDICRIVEEEDLQKHVKRFNNLVIRRRCREIFQEQSKFWKLSEEFEAKLGSLEHLKAIQKEDSPK